MPKYMSHPGCHISNIGTLPYLQHTQEHTHTYAEWPSGLKHTGQCIRTGCCYNDTHTHGRLLSLWSAKVRTGLRIYVHTVAPEDTFLAYTKYGCKWTFTPNFRPSGLKNTGQCKRTGCCYNELVVTFFRTVDVLKGKKSIPVDFMIYL